MKAKYPQNKGSTTVEAAIIVPLVILCILFVIYLSCLYCQRALLQCVADRAARAGADTWFSISADIATGKTEVSNNSLYWRVFDNGKKGKLARVKNYSEKLLKEKTFLEPLHSETYVEIDDYIVYKRLHISIENSYEIPGASLLGIFGIDRYIRFNVSSCANINDPGEFIRNTDFLLDMEKEIEKRYPGLKNIGDRVRDVLVKVKNNIGKLTD